MQKPDENSHFRDSTRSHASHLLLLLVVAFVASLFVDSALEYLNKGLGQAPLQESKTSSKKIGLREPATSDSSRKDSPAPSADLRSSGRPMPNQKVKATLSAAQLAEYRKAIPTQASKSLILDRQSFELVNDLRATETKNYLPQLGEIVLRQAGYTFFRVAVNPGLMVAESGFPVVRSLRNGRFSVLTGRLVVHFKKGQDREARDLDPTLFTIIERLEHLNIAILQLQPHIDIQRTYSRLATDQSIREVELELITGQVRAK